MYSQGRHRSHAHICRFPADTVFPTSKTPTFETSTRIVAVALTAEILILDVSPMIFHSITSDTHICKLLLHRFFLSNESQILRRCSSNGLDCPFKCATTPSSYSQQQSCEDRPRMEPFTCPSSPRDEYIRRFGSKRAEKQESTIKDRLFFILPAVRH